MGKKNKYQKQGEGDQQQGGSQQQAQQQQQGQQQRPQQQQQGQQQRPQQQQQEQRPQQQLQGQQQRPQQQQQGQQQRPQHQQQGQQQRPQQQQQGQQQRPQQQQQGQQQWPQQQQQGQQQRPQQQQQGQQQRPQQQQQGQQQRPQQQQQGQQQRPQQQQQGQQQRPQQQQQGQQQRPQQQQQGQQQRPQQQQQGQQQRPQQQQQGQQQRPQQQGPPQGQQRQGPPQQQAWQQGPPQGQQRQGPPQQQAQAGQRQQQAWQQGPPQGQPQQRQQQQQGWQQGLPQGPPQQRQGPPQQQQRSQGPSQRPSPSPSTVSSGSTSSKSSVVQGSPSTMSATSTTSKSGIVRGNIGREGVLETNYLTLNLDKMPNIAYHYDVTITPDRPKKFFRRAFQQFNREFFAAIAMAFDGVASFYTVEPLPIEKQFEKEVTVDDGKGRSLKYKIVIKTTDNVEIDLRSLRTYFRERIFDKPMRALQCLEVVLSSRCHDLGVRAGRSFYTKPRERVDLSDGFELWTGLFQAMILGDEPFLNVDISHKSFPSEMSVLDYLSRTFRNFNPNKKLEGRDYYSLAEFLKGLKILYTGPNALPKEYIFIELSRESAAEKKFLVEQTNERISIADYFQKHHKKRLQYPNLNCLQVGSTVKSISLPIEFCMIPGGQATKKKDDARQVQQMIKFAATSTNIRKAKIMTLLQQFQHNSCPLIQKFGIQIGNNFIDVKFRLLNAPAIEYFGRDLQRVVNGSWRMGNNSKFLFTVQKKHKWAVIFSNESRNINENFLYNKLVKLLLDAAVGINLDLDSNPLIERFNQIDTKLLELKKANYDLVIVVIPFRGTTYANIKQSAELKHGILTQCIKDSTVERRSDRQTALNLLLKINAKLNGTNHMLAANTHVPLKNVMFLGGDVTHPSPDQKHIPSVVGVAASHDPNGACYNMQYRLQGSAVENIEDMDSIFQEHLNVYKNHQKTYPQHVIYYRDGVSDGQFKIVKDNEIRSMRAVCKRLGIAAKITCIVAVKRHHTRFFPKQQTRDKFNNVEPGTVVDDRIVHPNEVQFFMVSHQSIQGTAKPTRYNVIEDDAKMDINDLQKLTHNMCHLFPRCNRAVSYPTPVYLAHLVAFRGRVYLEGTQRYGEPKAEYAKRTINSNFMKTNPMYFV